MFYIYAFLKFSKHFILDLCLFKFFTRLILGLCFLKIVKRLISRLSYAYHCKPFLKTAWQSTENFCGVLGGGWLNF